MRQYASWGRTSFSASSLDIKPSSRSSKLHFAESASILSYGNGRSYGDVCLSDDATIIDSRGLNKFIFFDREYGSITCESGVTLAQILNLIVPQGWFLAVTPGTQHITIGGAIANDVHGKNHHRVGSFGCFVEEFELYRSDGNRLLCSRNNNSAYFFATIGGIGLTGWIVWARIKLLAIQNASMVTNAYRFSNLKEYFCLNSQLEKTNAYTVAWIDCFSSGQNLGRGIYFTGEHASHQEKLMQFKKKSLSIPVTPRFSLINRYSSHIFNSFYYHRKLSLLPQLEHYETFFYPLDKINNWNRAYGHQGFFQYQFIVPFANAEDILTAVLKNIYKSKTGSFLAVLKTFGNIDSGGMLSFPRPGVTLALDFPNNGERTIGLFKKLDQIIIEAGGAIYPAKDACMSHELFLSGYPNLNKFIEFKDPRFNSNFWQRIIGE